jgi:hypothetical protein
MATEAPTSSGPTPAAAAAAAVSPDPLTAQLLEKHAAGEKLSPGEYGKLSWVGRKFGGFFGKSGAAPGSPQPRPPGNAASLAAVAPAQASAVSLAPVEIDDDLCRRVFSALLDHGDDFAVNFIERQAKLADATGESLDRFRAAARLSSNDKKLLINLAPDICRDLGIDPRRIAVYVAIGVLGFHGVNLWQCTAELKDLQKQKLALDKNPERPAATPAPTLPAAPPGEKAPTPALDPKGQTIVKFPN